jgi:hypothetical protein
VLAQQLFSQSIWNLAYIPTVILLPLDDLLARICLAEDVEDVVPVEFVGKTKDTLTICFGIGERGDVQSSVIFDINVPLGGKLQRSLVAGEKLRYPAGCAS